MNLYLRYKLNLTDLVCGFNCSMVEQSPLRHQTIGRDLGNLSMMDKLNSLEVMVLTSPIAICTWNSHKTDAGQNDKQSQGFRR